MSLLDSLLWILNSWIKECFLKGLLFPWVYKQWMSWVRDFLKMKSIWKFSLVIVLLKAKPREAKFTLLLVLLFFYITIACRILSVYRNFYKDKTCVLIIMILSSLFYHLEGLVWLFFSTLHIVWLNTVDKFIFYVNCTSTWRYIYLAYF